MSQPLLKHLQLIYRNLYFNKTHCEGLKANMGARVTQWVPLYSFCSWITKWCFAVDIADLENNDDDEDDDDDGNDDGDDIDDDDDDDDDLPSKDKEMKDETVEKPSKAKTETRKRKAMDTEEEGSPNKKVWY